MFNPFKAASNAASKAMGGHSFQSDKVEEYGGQPILSPFQQARQEWDDTAIQFSVVHTLSEYYILIIARFVRGYAVFERVLARQALGAIL